MIKKQKQKIEKMLNKMIKNAKKNGIYSALEGSYPPDEQGLGIIYDLRLTVDKQSILRYLSEII